MILQLINSDGSFLDLTDRATNGLYISEIDLGMPTVREVLDDYPNADGATDLTQFWGSRVISMKGTALSGSIVGSRQAALAQLMRFARPGLRQTLVYQFDSDAAIRTLNLRVSDWSAPVNRPGYTPFMIAWKAADPIAKSQTLNTTTVVPAGSYLGRTYSRVYPRLYPAATYGGSGIVTVTNQGDFPTWPTFRIFGPITNPKITWLDSSGGVITFTGISIAAGDWLAIDSRMHTVTLDSNVASDRYSFLDPTQTLWAPLQAGSSKLRLSGSGASAPSMAEINWYDAWLF